MMWDVGNTHRRTITLDFYFLVLGLKLSKVCSLQHLSTGGYHAVASTSDTPPSVFPFFDGVALDGIFRLAIRVQSKPTKIWERLGGCCLEVVNQSTTCSENYKATEVHTTKLLKAISIKPMNVVVRREYNTPPASSTAYSARITVNQSQCTEHHFKQGLLTQIPIPP